MTIEKEAEIVLVSHDSGSRVVEILLVEDNPFDAELIIRALKKANLGNHIVWMRDGSEALNYFFRESEAANHSPSPVPRVVLLDLKLPKIDGLGVLQRLKTNERTKDIPVVVVTSSTREEDLVHSNRLGANSYIVKPVDFEKFSEAVAELGVYWLKLNRTGKPGTGWEES